MNMHRNLYLMFGFLSLLAACSTSSNTVEPSPLSEQEFVVTSDIPYTSESLLDVYMPATPGEYPVVVAFHGANATKYAFKKMGAELAALGIVVFSVDWHSRLPTVQTTAEDYLIGWEDAACAVRFVQKHAPTYYGDPKRIIVVGHSYGGAVGATITLAGDIFQGDCLVNEGSALPDGFVGLDGAYHVVGEETNIDIPEDIIKLPDPFFHLDSESLRQDVQFKLFVGDESEVFIQAADDLHKSLLSVGYSSELIAFSDLNHAAIVLFPREEIINAIVEIAQNP